MCIAFDIYTAAAIGVLALLIGRFCNSIFPALRKICIPTPVTGGLVISIFTLLLYSCFGIETDFDATIKNICMTLFFASVGFMSDFRSLRRGGKALAIMLGLVFLLIVIQNVAGVVISAALGQNPLLGIACGSVSMSGGHGTSAGFADTLEQMGLQGASTLSMSAATFGIIAGAAIGGPLAAGIIRRRSLAVEIPDCRNVTIGENANSDPVIRDVEGDRFSIGEIMKAAFILILASGLGSLVSMFLTKSGLNFPSYFGALIVAVFIRNIPFAFPKSYSLNISAITSLGKVSLELFLGIAMVSLKLWELVDLALPMGIILVAQMLILVIFARYLAFPALGRDYRAAVLISGLCGFGLGATPNAMANMTAVCKKYHYIQDPFIIIPLVGAFFLDLMNIAVITVFLNFL